MKTSSSAVELNTLQVSFNQSLRIFMKSPTGDAADLIRQYNFMKKMRSAFSPELQTRTITIPHRLNSGLEIKSPAYRIIGLMRDKARLVNGFVHSFIVHGSYATQDFIPGWSDLDTMIVLKDCTFDSADNLLKAKKIFLKMGLLCYWIDPLAHHQLSFVTEFDLTYYPQSFLPLPSYDNGLLLLGQKQIFFNIRDDTLEQTVMMEKFRNYFKRKIENEDWSRDQYSWKNDLAHIFLLPSLLLQASGIYVYKKESFRKAKQFLNNFDARPIQEATEIMKRWKVFNLLKYLSPRLIISLPYRWAKIVVIIARKPSLLKNPTENPDQVKRLTEEFLRLYEYKK